MNKAYYFFIGIILNFGAIALNAQNREVEIEDLRHDWMVVDEETQHLLPYLPTHPTTTIYFDLDSKKHQGFELRIELQQDYFVFLNSHIIDHAPLPKTVYYAVDSLVKKATDQPLRFSVFSKKMIPANLKTTIIDRKGESILPRKKITEIQARIDKGHTDEFVTLTLILLGIIVSYRTIVYRTFSEYFSISNAISIRQRFELIVAQPLFSVVNLSFVLLYAGMAAASIYNILLFNVDLRDFLSTAWQSYSSLSVSFYLFLLFVGLMLLKRFLIFIVSRVFKFRSIRDLHFYIYFRWSLIMSGLLFLFTIINGISDGELFNRASSWIFVWLFIVLGLRLIQLWVVLNSQLNFHKLQIFAYLCSTEIFPLIFFLKIFVNH